MTGGELTLKNGGGYNDYGRGGARRWSAGLATMMVWAGDDSRKGGGDDGG